MTTEQAQNIKRYWGVTLFFLLIATASIVFNQAYQEKIFPSIATPILLSKEAAIQKAIKLNQQSTVPLPQERLNSAASYITINDVNNYLSLTDKSHNLLNKTLDEKTVQTSFWAVRLFISSEIEEHYFYFAPNGSPYGFSFTIPEDKELPNINKKQAFSIAEEKLNSYTIQGINTKNYVLKDYSQEKKLNRIDHQLIYENTKKTLVDAKLQIKITISGNQVTKLEPRVKLPETFIRNYKDMRSFNFALGSFGTIGIMLGYGAIIIYALLIGWKQNAINWKDAITASIIITILISLNNINFMPLSWFNEYQTTQSKSLFISQKMILFFYQAIGSLASLIPVLCAAEYLDRKAFPNHIQLWNWWKKDSAASINTSFLVVLGYIIFGISTGYQSIFYLLAQKIPSVWLPTGPLFSPDFISAYMPFLFPFSLSLQAGVWEECLFRAVPIATLLLIGIKYKRPSLALWVILPLQAIIFGIAHANYPQQPFYIRTLEMFLPFILYGVFYIYYGLIPCIISHYLFDVYQMSLIIFNMDTPMIWVQKVCSILCLLVPILIVIRAKIATKSLIGLPVPEKYLNKNWQKNKAPTPMQVTEKTHISTQLSTSKTRSAAIIAILAAGVTLLNWNQAPTLAQPLKITKAQALKIAQTIAKEQQIDLSESWTTTQTAKLKNPTYSIKFLSERLKKDQLTALLKKPILKTDQGSLQLESFLPHYAWSVRFSKFQGSQNEKANELTVSINNQYTAFKHSLSENTTRPSISEKAALKLAQSQLQKTFGTSTSFELIKQSSITTPSDRKDWQLTFQFKSPKALDIIKPRVDFEISGDQITGRNNYIFIPEKWITQQKSQEEKSLLFTSTLSIIKISSILFIIVFACKNLVTTPVNFSTLRHLFVGLISILAINYCNNYATILAIFNTIENITNQTILALTGYLIASIFTASLICLLAHYSTSKQQLYIQPKNSIYIALTGISLGLGFSAMKLITANLLAPEHNWQWGQVEVLSQYIPQLYPAHLVPGYLLNTMNILALVIYHTSKTHRKTVHTLLTILCISVFLHQTTFVESPLVTSGYFHITNMLVQVLYVALIWPLIKDQPLVIPFITVATTIPYALINTKNPVFINYNIIMANASLMLLVLAIGLVRHYLNHQVPLPKK